LIFLTSFLGTQIIVSQNDNSMNTNNCGKISRPCRTIEYALNKAKSRDTLLIDSGDKKNRYRYYLDQTLNIDKDLSITSLKTNNSANAMVILEPRKTDVVLFQLTANLTVTFINFVYNAYTRAQITLFRVQGGDGFLMVARVSFQTDAASVFIFQINNGNWRIKMVKCEINMLNNFQDTIDFSNITSSVKRKQFSNTGNIIVSIIECKFISYNFTAFFLAVGDQSGSIKIHIKIQKTELSGIDMMFAEIYKTEIYHSNFSLCGITFDSYMGNCYVLLSKSKFQHMVLPMYITTIENCEIEHCMFTDAALGVLNIQNSTVSVISSTFRHNKQVDVISKFSNFHFDGKSDVFISGCTFEQNTATIKQTGTLDGDLSLNQFVLANTTVKGGVLNDKQSFIIELSIDIDEPVLQFQGNVTISCPLNYFYQFIWKDMYFLFTCVRCDKTKYNLQEEARIEWNQTKNGFNHHNITCLPCPYEASCEETIKSKGSYWGYLTDDRTLKFKVCPPSYCCTSLSQCLSYNTCNSNREGRLCSDCKHNYSVSLFGNYHCIKNDECNDMFYFWMIFFVVAFLYLVVFMYLREICCFLKRIPLILSNNGNVNHRVSTEEEEGEGGGGEEENQDGVFSSHYQLIPDHSNETNECHENSTMIAGIIKVMFFFYQTASIIRITTSTKTEYRIPPIIDIITSFFNVRLEVPSSNINICPIVGGTVVQIGLVKSGFLLFCPILLISTISTYTLQKQKCKRASQELPRGYTSIDSHIPFYSKVPFLTRLKCTYIQLLLIGFSSFAVLSFQIVHCVDILGKKYLYIQATTECYNVWQGFVILVIVVWVVPFCLSLYCGCRLLRKCRISPNQFLLIITFPPTTTYYLTKSYLGKVEGDLTKSDAMDAKYLLRVVNEPFRDSTDGDRKVEWEPVLIMRRLLLVVTSTFIISPVEKLYPIGFLLAVFLAHHMFTKPYKDARLNGAESISLITLCLF